MLDVIHLPGLADEDEKEDADAFDNQQIIDYQKAYSRVKETIQDTGGALKDGAYSVKDFVKNTIGKGGDSETEEVEPIDEIGALIAQEKSSRKESWSKSQLLESP